MSTADTHNPTLPHYRLVNVATGGHNEPEEQLNHLAEQGYRVLDRLGLIDGRKVLMELRPSPPLPSGGVTR